MKSGLAFTQSPGETKEHQCQAKTSSGWKVILGVPHLVTKFLYLYLLLDFTQAARVPAVGCADGSREGLYNFYSVAACQGHWEGHVSNASHLCAPGWRVCTAFDQEVLSNITWAHARLVSGCLAFNAAQDGGRCLECLEDLEQDDMAGIGQGCAHQYKGQTSCISGGRIDASCCVDSHFQKACHYKPGLITGVVCCRLPAKAPNIVVKPPRQLRVYRDLIFLLTCQASGMPPPRVNWYKNGRQLGTGDPRISPLTSGDLLVTLSRPSDTGLYTCEAINEQGMDMASSYVSVVEKISGCADQTTEGFHTHRNIHACAGVWKGHVTNAKALCARGWKVCNHRNRRALRNISHLEVSELPGCYAYNAANKRNSCRRCTSNKMAGVGKDCGWASTSHPSCLVSGRIDVFAPNTTSSCEYAPGLTTGTLCCKKRKRKGRLRCSSKCQNNGKCVGYSYGRCKCAEGYKGSRCQIAICNPDCGSKGRCVRPNKCRCLHGYTGKTCRLKIRPCVSVCQNGGRCRNGKCVCPATFWGKSCQYPLQHVLVSQLDRVEN